MSHKIIARIKGGLGNQLFCYAAAKNLAFRTGFELVLDHDTGFKRDYTYKRKYELNFFQINNRFASEKERLYPFERITRSIYKFIAKFQKLNNKIYIDENCLKLNLNYYKPNKTIILDGLWQNQKYFNDISNILKNDLIFNLKIPIELNNIINNIQSSNSIALHVRWFDSNEENDSYNNLNIRYYNSAIKKINSSITNAHYFVFSDDISATEKFLKFNDTIVTYVSHDTRNLHSIYDMYLMSLCKNFIISNSTFSWWSAWLCRERNPIFLIPHNQIELLGANKWDPICDSWKLCKID